MHTDIHTDMHTYIHTYIHTDRQTDRQTDRHTYIQYVYMFTEERKGIRGLYRDPIGFSKLLFVARGSYSHMPKPKAFNPETLNSRFNTPAEACSTKGTL